MVLIVKPKNYGILMCLILSALIIRLWPEARSRRCQTVIVSKLLR
jgi:hypothetical protein